MTEFEQVKELLNRCTVDQQREIFKQLRKEFPIHALETQLNAAAEIILEAIYRSGGLTLRGIRGVIAQTAFELSIASKLPGFQLVPISGDPPYDALLRDSKGDIRIQVKMQRLKDGQPMMAMEAYRYLRPDMYVVETQRTRGGKDAKTGKATRPYTFGEFDILAVSFHPSTNDWNNFLYTVERWLISSPDDPDCLLKFQSVPVKPNDDWTDDLARCIEWFRSAVDKEIGH